MPLTRLPEFLIRHMRPAASQGDVYPRGLITEMLLQAAQMPDEQQSSQLVLLNLEPNGEGNYRLREDLSNEPAVSGSGTGMSDDDGTSTEPDDHRQVAFLPAKALLL